MCQIQVLKIMRGFSMPEVLLSLFVLTVGLVTVVSVMAGSLRYSYITRDTIVAAELVQEGVELVRNVRDNNFISGTAFTSGSGFDASKPYCRIDWNETSLNCFPTHVPVQYYLQYSGGLYAHATGVKERYSRYIYINYNDTVGSERATVRSFVYWGTYIPPDTGNAAGCTTANKCVYAETFLTAWK